MDQDGKISLNLFIKEHLSATLSVALFHALAQKRVECVVLTEPSGKCISLGYFDNANAFLDFEYCKNHNLPIIRRQTGGGTVLLDKGQIFYQFIFSKSNKTIPFKMENVYKYFSSIVMSVYEELGIKTKYKPVADIFYKDKKISGQGAGDINNMLIFVGNILMDFDYKTMANVISYVKDKTSFENILQENITTLSKEGFDIKKEDIFQAFIDILKKVFDDIKISDIPEDIIDLAKDIERELSSSEVIKEDTGKTHEKFKVKEGCFLNPNTLQILE